jgi:flavodoxin
MKRYTAIIVLIVFMVISFSLVGNSEDNRKSSKNSNYNDKTSASNTSKQGLSKNYGDKTGNVLVVCYSLTGNTLKVANIIRNTTKGDIFVIQPEYDYSKVKSRSEMEEIGKQQVEEGFKPKLKNYVSNIDAYDLIIVGSPVWWFSVSPPVMSFLAQYDFKGKKVVPFCTCGSTYGNFFTQFRNAIPDAKVLNGLVFIEPELRNEGNVKRKIDTWLKDACYY